MPSWYVRYDPPGETAGSKTIIVDASPGAKAPSAPQQDKVPALIDTLRHDASVDARKRAAVKLGDLGLVAKAAVPALIQALQEDRAADVRSAAASALGEMGPVAGKSAIPALNAALSDSDGFVKQAARNALFRVDPRR